MDLNKIIKLRRDLHLAPEVSNEEEKTISIIEDYISHYNPTKVIKNIGGHGAIFYFEKGKNFKTVALRADLDALPIIEENQIEYQSQNHGVSHKCGHDGHMSMVCGVLEYLDDFSKINIALLFQPAEETGEGAKRMIKDPKFREFHIDYIFGLHNLPGVKENKILSCDGVFACSSVGMKLEIEGLTSHAAEPTKAITPYPLITDLLSYINKNQSDQLDDNFKIITATHINVGTPNFGITPGSAQVYLTLRSVSDELIKLYKDEITALTQRYTKLKTKITFHDEFPALVNTKLGFETLKEASMEFDFENMNAPFKWSEDFGHFTQALEGAYFGLGVGVDHYNLHHKDYDFNENVLMTGIQFYKSLIIHISQKQCN